MTEQKARLPMPLPQTKKDHYTYEDYATWPDDERYELIEGVPYLMSPAPNRAHQEISVELTRQFGNFLKGKPCQVFHAPFDVVLKVAGRKDTVVEPDLVVVCDKSKLSNGKNCVGAPDMLVEVLSPSTTRHDRLTKLNLYRKHGVKEYWIVDPESRHLEVLTLKDGEYVHDAYDETETVAVKTLPGLEINLAEVFGVEQIPQ
jgi:Uma2 family endonuclease